MIWRGSSESPEQGEQAQEDRGSGAGSVGTRIESILDAAERAAAGIREDAQEWARHYAEESRRRADEAAAERIKEISALTDGLINRARSVAQQSDELISALDEAGRRVLNNARPDQQEPAPRQPASPSEPESPPEAGPPPEGGPPHEAGSPPEAGSPVPENTVAPPPPPEPPPTRGWRPRAAAPPRPAEPTSPPPRPQPDPPRAAPAPATNRAPVSEGARLLATQMAVAGSTRDEIAWRLREEFGIQDSTAILDEIGI